MRKGGFDMKCHRKAKSTKSQAMPKLRTVQYLDLSPAVAKGELSIDDTWGVAFAVMYDDDNDTAFTCYCGVSGIDIAAIAELSIEDL